MKVINASYEIMDNLDGRENDIYKRIERAGRTCYKSEQNITEKSAQQFVRNIVKSGHEAMLEHVSLTVKFIVDRGVSHELVRHRVASFAQESTRYCNYSNDKFGNEITVIRPCFWNPREDDALDDASKDSKRYAIWRSACQHMEDQYFRLLEEGCTPQEARSVLPNSLKTEVIMTANLREWRHILKLRAAGTTGAPHPQMAEVMVPLLRELQEKLPAIFEDIKINETEAGKEQKR